MGSRKKFPTHLLSHKRASQTVLVMPSLRQTLAWRNPRRGKLSFQMVFSIVQKRYDFPGVNAVSSYVFYVFLSVITFFVFSCLLDFVLYQADITENTRKKYTSSAVEWLRFVNVTMGKLLSNIPVVLLTGTLIFGKFACERKPKTVFHVIDFDLKVFSANCGYHIT